MNKTALIHDWIVSIGGGERVLEAQIKFIQGPIFTLIQDHSFVSKSPFKDLDIRPSFLQRIPFSKKLFRNFLPFFPLAIEQFDLSEYDLIISNSHAVAKGVITRSHQLHICYCFTPMRYAWDLYHDYLKSAPIGLASMTKLILHYLRNWDIGSLHRVDHFVAISKFVAKRIHRFYRRTASVIYPPVAVHNFFLKEQKEDYYITVSRLVPYKRVDLIVEAFRFMPHKKLVVVGDGPEMNKIKKRAHKNVEILGARSDSEISALMANAKAFLFAPVEDFGIAPIEAMACGTPVIAYGRGAALETILDRQTGLFFADQTIKSLIESIEKFEGLEFNACAIRKHAEQFSEERFAAEFKKMIDQKWGEYREGDYFSRGQRDEALAYI
ncbi:MAG: glycosyltransferase [Chlamydiota bacterium]